ncbi:MAG: hypothetical protein GTO45_05205 [Candidatus Aminicenantes bacterium]|nr:hypothetical protein [Candidatus Aminicenantes bacterium]NIM78149.1 hypothetical protein [Candidatus Aminicenantes bacterium]NIN17473.1 hypothetical protein [Candidatus Aminicenantes bacterium]NIN41369.1 hypothetical protein [Candidatus Aminicenantes bacterium]NIN84135.1 hypothetical protein [Candidatus Aminicenantes bacterium]
MKIVLINPNYQSPAGIEPGEKKTRVLLPREISECLGLGYLAAALEESDIHCKIVDADLLNLEDNEILDICNTYQPNLIGITFLHDTFPQGLKLLRLIKKNIPVPIVVEEGEWCQVNYFIPGFDKSLFTSKFCSRTS